MSYNKKHIIQHSHREYSSPKAKFVDVDGNIILDKNGNTVNRYKNLRKMIDQGDVTIYRDIRPQQAFYYLVSYEAQKKLFDEFRLTGKPKSRNVMYHVYMDPPDDLDGKTIVKRTKKIKEDDTYYE